MRTIRSYLRAWRVGETGQTTAEYALVLMGAGAIAFLLIAWANGGAVKKLFDSALDFLLSAG
jgi:Flp pilus assembly pilin Flp